MNMKRNVLAAIAVASVATTSGTKAQVVAAPSASTQPVDAAFEASIDRRAGETVDEMQLADGAKAARVKEAFKQHFRDIQAWDVLHGQERAALEKSTKASPDDAEGKARLDALNAELQAMQASFFTRMNAELTPEQVERIKNKLVGGRYEHNIQGFKVEYPDLPAEEWDAVVKMGQQARDEAMPLGTAAKNEIDSK